MDCARAWWPIIADLNRQIAAIAARYNVHRIKGKMPVEIAGEHVSIAAALLEVTAKFAAPVAGPEHAQSPYLRGARVQIVSMSQRRTVVADTLVTAVADREDGSFVVHAVLSDSRANVHLVPAVPAPADGVTAHPTAPGHLTYGVSTPSPRRGAERFRRGRI